MVTVILQGDKYIIEMNETETIQININGSPVYSKVVGSGKVANIAFNLEERIVEI